MKRSLKLFVLSALAFMFTTPLLVSAEAAKTPIYDALNNVFYANGTPITIIEENGVTVISWDNGFQEVDKEVIVYGGGVAGTSYESSSITMNSGTVASIYGGGKGTTTESADVENVSITINGGTIISYKEGTKYYAGTVYGGGSLSSKTEVVDIKVKGGTIGTLSGGGRATVNSDAVGNKATPEKSPNSTQVVTITISAGTINDANLGYGIVYGGGQGLSYVNETTINISGNADLSKTWLVGGGSNGRTDYATINVNGGSINTLQTINRGSMIDANVNVTKGTISNFFVGGEDPETFDKDIVNGGFLGNIVVDITGGTITKLLPGSDYDKSIQPNAANVMVFYKEKSVLNASDLEVSLGTSAKEIFEVDEFEKDVVIDNLEEDIELDENIFEGISNTDKVYAIEINKDDQLYGWLFDGSTITDTSIEVNTKIDFSESAPDAIKEELEEKVSDLENVMFLNFAHHGKLPGKATIVYEVSSKYEDGTKLYIRHYNETSKTLEEPIEVTVENGTIMFEITSCSSYVISTTAPVSNVTVPNTGDNVIYLVGLLVIGIIGISLTSKKLLKN